MALQRVSSDLRLNPHLHVVFLDGVYQEQGEEVVFHALPHVSTRDVGAVLEQAVRRIARYLSRRGLLHAADDKEGDTSNGDIGNETDREPTLAEGHAALRIGGLWSVSSRGT